MTNAEMQTHIVPGKCGYVTTPQLRLSPVIEAVPFIESPNMTGVTIRLD